jgi:hypothetical protein
MEWNCLGNGSFNHIVHLREKASFVSPAPPHPKLGSGMPLHALVAPLISCQHNHLFVERRNKAGESSESFQFDSVSILTRRAKHPIFSLFTLNN